MTDTGSDGAPRNPDPAQPAAGSTEQVSAPHMSAAEFRRYGRQVVDWIADYWDRIEAFPVRSDVTPGSVRAHLPAHPPQRGGPFEELLADLDRVVLPGITHWQHPSFFGYFPANASGPAVLADLLSAGLGVQGMLWTTSPACTEFEQHMLDWLAELLGLPAAFRGDPGGGVIQDSASSANLVALLAALHRATDGAAGRDGLAAADAGGPTGVVGSAGGRSAGGAGAPASRYAVYVSSETHSSVEKALRIAGLGVAALRSVEVDDVLAMRPAALRDAIRADRAAGVLPVMVVATIGTTSTTAIDPVPAIGAVCREFGVWLHVDAAYAGAAAVCPELRWTHAGVELADSYCMDPHKWLLTNFDCDAFWVADSSALRGALSVLPDYLRNPASDSGAVVDYRDWQVPLGRRFRALKLWAVLRCYGAEGLRAHIRCAVDQAGQLAGWIRSDPRFEVVTPHPFGLVCFRLRGDGPATDDANSTLLRALNASGRLLLTHTRVAGRYTLRAAVGGTRTEPRHVAAAWADIQAAADQLRPA